MANNKKYHKYYYLYILYDPTLVSKKFYVGYSYDPNYRLQTHIDVKNENLFKDKWINKMERNNIRPSYFIVSSFLSEELACEAEIELIAFCKNIGIKLINVLPGGRGVLPYKNGEDQIGAKLTWGKVEEIRNKYFNNKISRKILAEQYGVSKSLIRNVVHYENWINSDTIIPNNLEQLLKDRANEGRMLGHLSNPVGSKHHNSKLKEKDISEIRKLKEAGMTVKKIAELFNVGKTTIGHVVKYENWKHI